jgi:hypothetical protein
MRMIKLNVHSRFRLAGLAVCAHNRGALKSNAATPQTAVRPSAAGIAL